MSLGNSESICENVTSISKSSQVSEAVPLPKDSGSMVALGTLMLINPAGFGRLAGGGFMSDDFTGGRFTRGSSTGGGGDGFTSTGAPISSSSSGNDGPVLMRFHVFFSEL